MTTSRTLTLAASAALLLAAAPARAQDMINDAETRYMLFIEQCLQRAAEEKVPEERIDDFIDRCLEELYAQQDEAAGNDDLPQDEDGADAPGGAD